MGTRLPDRPSGDVHQAASFSGVYSENYVAVYGYLRARILRTHDTEDLCQEAFLRAFRLLKRYDGSTPIKYWVLGIARNVLREYVRKVGRRKEVAWTELCLELEETAQTENPYEDILPLLPVCTLQLTESARDALNLRYMAGLKLQAIADETDSSLSAVKVLMHRARQTLRQCIQKQTG
ncbi:MAG: RNA polymerase sigma factor [Phycisphaerae bacterium]|nr:RNA polymerase sigma factor [Phycisphaerae bacterium]